MKLTDANLEQHKLPVGNYGFSATKIDDLGASEYTLCTIVADRSGSTARFRTEMEESVKKVIAACKFSERADNLLIRLTTFSTRVEEVHGFKLLDKCNPDDYTGCMPPGGNTALYDATENAIGATVAMGRKLIAEEFSANAIVVVITDGDDNESTLQAKHVKDALMEAVSKEALESIIVILVGVNVTDPHMGTRLAQFQKEAGITQYVEIGNATPKAIAKLGEFISQSISSQSKALGTGGPSQPINPAI